MIAAKTLDRMVPNANTVQTGVRFEFSHNRLQATDCMGCKSIQQFMTVEVCKSLGSAANE